jgi:cell shape-determining protein MreC
VSGLAKIFVVVNLVLAIMFCAFTMVLYAKRVDYNDRWQTTLKQLADTEKKLKAEITNLTDQNSKLKSDLDAQTTKYNNRDAEYQRLSVAMKQVEAKLGDIEAERRFMLAQIQAKDEELNARADKIVEMHQILQDMQQALEIAKQHETNATNLRVEAENQLNAVQEQFTAVMKEKKKVEDDLAYANWILERLQAAGITTSQALEQPAMPAIPAKVLAVDKEVNLVMLSVGRNDGVKKGYTFSVYRTDKFVGKVRVEKVYDDMCAGVILKTYKVGDLEIQEGDDANTQLGY